MGESAGQQDRDRRKREVRGLAIGATEFRQDRKQTCSGLRLSFVV
jgi:hypothetical protein